MDKNNFFVKETELEEFEVFGQIFKFKKVTADDELRWLDDYRESLIERDEEGKEVKAIKQNYAKLAKCKLRNIVEVPFTKEELKEITGLDKDFKDYSDQEKDNLFGKLNPGVFNKLVKLIDISRSNQKKS